MKKGAVAKWLVLGVSVIGGAAAETPALVEPGGRYAIGRTGYHWTDLQRGDRFAGGAQAHRELMVYLWYPAAGQAGEGKGAYFPGAKQMDGDAELQGRMRREFGENWPLIVSGAIHGHAVEGGAVARRPKRFPVVIFSHGNGSTTFAYTTLIEDLASRGYVVAAIEHTQTAIGVVFPDGRRVPFYREVSPVGLSPAERKQRMNASISALIEEGAADVRFVMDRLGELNAGGGKEFRLAGRLDLSRTAVMGHSAGAEFASRAGELDGRFKACVDLDGAMVPVAALPVFPDGARLKQPLLFLEADHPRNRMGGSAAELEEFFRKKEEQLGETPAGSYGVVLKSPGIAHPSFSDMPLFFAGRDGYPEVAQIRHNHELITAFIRAFLDKELKQEVAPLLDEPGRAGREAVVRRYGR